MGVPLHIDKYFDLRGGTEKRMEKTTQFVPLVRRYCDQVKEDDRLWEK